MFIILLFKMIRGTCKQMISDTMSPFYVWPCFWMTFCSILLILSLHRLYKQLNLIFTKFLSKLKLFNMIKEAFWHNVVYIVSFLTYEVTLLYLNNLTNSPHFRIIWMILGTKLKLWIYSFFNFEKKREKSPMLIEYQN